MAQLADCCVGPGYAVLAPVSEVASCELGRAGTLCPAAAQCMPALRTGSTAARRFIHRTRGAYGSAGKLPRTDTR